jgi:pilus assembly protein CpaB
MLSLSLACGGVAASEVGGRVRDVERRVGAPVPVIVAARNVEPDKELRRDDLTVHQVPARFVPPGAFDSPDQIAGARASVPLPAGSPITEAQLEGASGGGPGGAREPGGLRRGERAVEVAVSGGAALAAGSEPGARVDVLVSTDAREGPGRSFLALQDVELLDLRPGEGGGGSGAGGDEQSAAGGPTAVATLRVTLRQAVYLTAAQNFAREVRLLSRPPGDSRRAARTVVGASGL